jgi:peptidyl-prolyl cis-trans isomerase A (cyclophilin A)
VLADLDPDRVRRRDATSATCSPPSSGTLPGASRPPSRGTARRRGGRVDVVTEATPARRAVLHTNHGDITVELFPDHAPKTVANFADLAEGRREWTHPRTRAKTTDRLYDGTVFHRIIDGFMIQGGDPLGQGIGGPGYQFGDEIHPDLAFTRPYLLAMANAGPGTNGSQFFITVAATPWLTGKHTIFGEVADQAGREVVDRIGKVATARGDRPVEDVVLQSVEVQRS